jgi:hypothetical protein
LEKYIWRGYAPGSSCSLRSCERIRDIGGRLVTEHGEALEILANHDPGALQS